MDNDLEDCFDDLLHALRRTGYELAERQSHVSRESFERLLQLRVRQLSLQFLQEDCLDQVLREIYEKKRREEEGRKQEIISSLRYSKVDTAMVENGDQCPICLAEFEMPEDTVNLEGRCCGRWYHSGCLLESFKFRLICPLCRKKIETAPPNANDNVLSEPTEAGTFDQPSLVQQWLNGDG